MALFFLFSIFLPIFPIFCFHCQPQLNELNLFDPSNIGPDHFIELSSSTSTNSNCATFSPPSLANYALAMIDLGQGIVFTADFSRITTKNHFFVIAKNERIADLLIDHNSGDVGWAASDQKGDQNSVAKLMVLIRIEEEADQHRGDTEARNIWDKMRLAKWTEEGRAKRQNAPIPLTREFTTFLAEHVVDALVFANRQNAHIDERIMREIFAHKRELLKKMKIVTLVREHRSDKYGTDNDNNGIRSTSTVSESESNSTIERKKGTVESNTVYSSDTVNRECEVPGEGEEELDTTKLMGVLEPNWGQPTPGRPNLCTEPTQLYPIDSMTLRTAIMKMLRKLDMANGLADDCTFEQTMDYSIGILAKIWRKETERQADSVTAFQGLLSCLEYCLDHSVESVELFARFIGAIGEHAAHFWKSAISYLYDSDMTNGTNYRDALLFSLVIYDLNSGTNKLLEFYTAIPGIRKSLLGTHVKHFRQQFNIIHRRNNDSGTDNNRGEDQSKPSGGSANFRSQNAKMRFFSVGPLSPPPSPKSDTYLANLAGGVGHNLRQRVINVSNASPVGLRLSDSGKWLVKPGSGGLVSCMNPVISADIENMWLTNFGMNIHNVKVTSITSRLCTDRKLKKVPSGHLESPATNTLGLPVTCQSSADLVFHVIADDELKKKEGKSLLKVLNDHNRGNYKLVPVILREQDYHPYYSGISNGLLWPALHNLPEYISADYDNPELLKKHWRSYVRVNYQFAIDALRNSRPQDFIWIHDYHLMLTGMIMQSLDNKNLEIGFFLHTPFQPPDELFDRYAICGLAILQGLLRFTKVGFQLFRDRDRFVQLVQTHLPEAEITEAEDEKLDVVVVTYQGWTCSLGVFPVTIKNKDFLKIAQDPKTIQRAKEIREKIFGPNPPDDVRLFFAVERFDYTKGIKERLEAFLEYLEKNTKRRGKDVLFQVAVTSRPHIEAYRIYQEQSLALAKAINDRFSDDIAYPGWRPVIFRTDSLERNELVAHYLAMDVGVVTPRMDGNNLVKKEMVLCNPGAGLILSTGAGSEVQVARAGLWSDADPSYHRVRDPRDTRAFAEAFRAAAEENKADRLRHGRKLKEFVMGTDIEKWSAAFLDPSWSHLVIHKVKLITENDRTKLMIRARDLRRNIVERVLKGIPVRPHVVISLENAQESLQNSLITNANGNSDQSSDSISANSDIKANLVELGKDLQFLKLVQSDDANRVEQFIVALQGYQPNALKAKFRREMDATVNLFSNAVHFDFLFTNFFGTLSSAYTGVILTQFARRWAQTCAMVSSMPLSDILEKTTLPSAGQFFIGAGSGREWGLDSKTGFKDRIKSAKFDKGDGIQFFTKKMELDLREGAILICGTSEADLPMLRICLENNPKNVFSVWLLPDRNAQLRRKVEDLFRSFGNQNLVIVSSADVLVGAMAKLTQQKMIQNSMEVIKSDQQEQTGKQK